MTVFLDGDVVLQAVQVGAVSSVNVPAGSHQIRMQNAGGTSQTISATASFGKIVTATAVANGPGVFAAILSDSGAVVASGKTKLRVVHLAASGAVEIWRTQPDYQTPIHIMTPFNYKDESPYLQSDPGYWEVSSPLPEARRRVPRQGRSTSPAANGERRFSSTAPGSGCGGWWRTDSSVSARTAEQRGTRISRISR